MDVWMAWAGVFVCVCAGRTILACSASAEKIVWSWLFAHSGDNLRGARLFPLAFRGTRHVALRGAVAPDASPRLLPPAPHHLSIICQIPRGKGAQKTASWVPELPTEKRELSRAGRAGWRGKVVTKIGSTGRQAASYSAGPIRFQGRWRVEMGRLL